MTDGVQVNAPLLLKQQVKQQFVPRSQLVQGQKVQLPIGQTATNGSKRNGSQFVSAIQLKPNNQPVPATGVYRKIAQPFSRPGESKLPEKSQKSSEKFFLLNTFRRSNLRQACSVPRETLFKTSGRKRFRRKMLVQLQLVFSQGLKLQTYTVPLVIKLAVKV